MADERHHDLTQTRIGRPFHDGKNRIGHLVLAFDDHRIPSFRRCVYGYSSSPHCCRTSHLPASLSAATEWKIIDCYENLICPISSPVNQQCVTAASINSSF